MQWITRRQWNELANEKTDAHRVCTHRNGWLDRYGDWMLETRADGTFPDISSEGFYELAERYGYTPRGWLAKDLAKDARDQKPPRLIAGEAPRQVVVQESGLRFNVEPGEGYSTGLFLDQRLNRQWILSLRPQRMLNLFAYTGSFSVIAASVGSETTSVDVSRRALSVARSNFEVNEIGAESGHRFVAEDVMKFVPRLRKRGDNYDLIVLDPPTFGRAGGRVFRVERDMPVLVRDCWDLLSPGGWLLVSCNYAKWSTSNLREVCLESLNGMGIEMQAGKTPPEIPSGAISWRLHKKSA